MRPSLSRSAARTLARASAFALVGLTAAQVVACEQLEDAKDTLDGLTNSMVIEAVYLGVEAPDLGSAIDLSSSDFAQGTSVKVYIADASDPTSLEDAPVSGAMVDLVSDGNGGQLPLEDKNDGSYVANEDEDGLAYVAEQVALSADYDGETHQISVNAPPTANVDIATKHSVGNPMNIDISDQSFDGLLVVVLEATGGEVTFSNLPDSIEALYEFTHGESELSVEIPGGAFNETGIYAVGVAGTRNAGVDDMTDINTALSTFVAGKFKFHGVTVQ